MIRCLLLAAAVVCLGQQRRVLLHEEKLTLAAMQQKTVLAFPLEQQAGQLEVRYHCAPAGEGVLLSVRQAGRLVAESKYQNDGLWRLALEPKPDYRLEVRNMRQRLGSVAVDLEVSIVFAAPPEARELDPARRRATIAISIGLFVMIAGFALYRLGPPIAARLGFLLLLALSAHAQVVEKVTCLADASQSYALYLPSNYTPTRPWSLLIAFDPRARGLTPVEIYRAAAEKYGYIVVGSNNSRNGSWATSQASISAIWEDVGKRYAINPKRIYTAGMSGGARVAMQVALASGNIAGVVASSAGFPDGAPRKSAPFPIFGTAGTEDFNWIEMKQLDRMLTTPHKVVFFNGGHVWLSSELAMEALGWMDEQAARTGPPEPVERRKDKKEKALEDRELRQLRELNQWIDGLDDPARAAESLRDLRGGLRQLQKAGTVETDSDDRRLARRVLRGIVAGARERVKSPELKRLLDELGLSQSPRG